MHSATIIDFEEPRLYSGFWSGSDVLSSFILCRYFIMLEYKSSRQKTNQCFVFKIQLSCLSVWVHVNHDSNSTSHECYSDGFDILI